VRPELDETLQAPSDPERTATLAARPGAPAPPAPGLAPGQQLGHFRIEKRLGVGGMGEVYLATDLALDRPVAVKVLPEHLARDPGRRERLVREARAQARITHPHVGHIYFIGEDENRLYFAMEYVAGKTLAERIAEGPMHVDEALAVIRAATLGLREAQRSGFLHRDVKPSNLMIDSHGMLKVLDFGLAAGGAAGEAAHDGPVAQTSLAGTPLYMSPEQARGEALDLRSDMYALGATLFHLVSGKPPFQADSVGELITMHASANRPVLPRGKKQARTRIAAIDELCSRMMAARPDDRFGSYDELLKAIEMISITHTRPGGVMARGIAGFVDFIIVSFVNAVLVNVIDAVLGTAPQGGATLFSLLALYYFITTTLWGRTIGKAVFELEVVDVAHGARPPPGRIARRTLFLFAPIIVLGLASYWFEDEGPHVVDVVITALTVAWAVLCIANLVYASARVPGKRAMWDRLSGAMVRYRTPPTSAI
jgi:eukaryotic-like serine/threonine-protein kinase